MRTKIACYILFILLLLFAHLGAEDVLKVTASGRASQDIKQVSKARAMAFRAAVLEGYKKIAEKAGLGKITRSGSIEYMYIKAFIKGAKVVSKNYLTDYEVEIVMEISLSQLVKNVSDYKTVHSEHESARVRKKIIVIENKLNSLRSELEELKKKLEEIE